MKKTERIPDSRDDPVRWLAAEQARAEKYFQEAVMEFTDVTHIAGLLQRAWFLIANGGWSGTGKPAGWEAAALTWRGDYEAWMKTLTSGPDS